MKARKIMLIVIIGIFCFVLYSYNESKKIYNGLYINDTKATESDTLYYNEKVSIKCDICNDNNSNRIINDNGNYVVRTKFGKVKIVVDLNRKFNVYNYLDKEIHNFDTNNMAFYIKDGDNIKVNNKALDSGYY